MSCICRFGLVILFMIEVEFKVQVPKDEFAKAMTKLIFDNVFQKEKISMEDLYFQHPCKNFKKTDEALRVRQIGDKILIAYKGPKLTKKAKTREELEIRVVAEFSSVKAFFEKLGFAPILTVKKERTTFVTSQGIKVSFDVVDELGTFIELETEIPDKDKISYHEQQMMSFLKDYLNVKKGKLVRKSYLELLLEKKNVKM